jgi:4-hydroxy-3-methylbut-2-enyl diphosphate reductase
LSVEDAREIVEVLRARFPLLAEPRKDDICYATTNRQEVVKAIAPDCDLLLVVGSKNSSNSLRLVEVGLRAGARAGQLIDDAGDIDDAWFEGVSSVGLTAGASAPEVLVQGVIDHLARRFALEVEEVAPTRETVSFKLPRALTA